jgi:hypothetical protein
MKRTLLLLAMLSAANAATAITVQGTPPANPAAGNAQKFTPPAAAKSNSSDNGLRGGTLEAVNAAGGTFNVHGQPLTFDPKKVKIFSRSGQPASLASLRKGSAVRFTLDPRDKKHQRVAVIYVD